LDHGQFGSILRAVRGLLEDLPAQGSWHDIAIAV
jgi:hypothetical protein